MEYGFKNQTLDIRQEIDGVHFRPLEHLSYASKDGRFIRVMLELRSDAGSIPKVFQNILSPRGKLMFTYVLHDACFQNKTEVLNDDGSWSRITFTEQESNDLLKEAAISQGANEVERDAIYGALELFGWLAFRDDRAKLPNR